MADIKQPTYYMFIDESGDASLNNRGKNFLLSAVIIDQKDFEIIQGYLKLLKRKFFNDDYKPLHCAELFEKPYLKYRKLRKPRNVTDSFVQQLHDILNTIPYYCCVYVVDKPKLWSHHKYIPKKGRKPLHINLDLPYELAATEAILDFTNFLKNKKSMGEIVIESRLHRDSNFVMYFDNARKPNFPGGTTNPLFHEVRKRIPSLFISNKGSGNNGLEIADIVSYIKYRTMFGDPFKRMKLPMRNVINIHAAIKKRPFKGTSIVHKINKVSV